MVRATYEFRGRLDVLTPLHVGSGEFTPIPGVGGKKGSKDLPEVAVLATDALDRPYIPSTALKGLLRRLAEAHVERNIVDRIFGRLKVEAPKAGAGEPEEAPETATSTLPKALMGALVCRGATLYETGGTSPAAGAGTYAGLPYVAKIAAAVPEYVAGEPAPRRLAANSFIAARTRIDSDSGTAKDAGLFFREMVAPGTAFELRLSIETSGDDAGTRARDMAIDLARLLHLLTEEEGHSLGKGQGDGLGRLRLDAGSVTVRRRILSSSGEFRPEPADDVWRGAKPPQRLERATGTAEPFCTVRFELHCPGPFLIVDASAGSERKERSDEPRGKKVQIRPQKAAQDEPLVTGTSLSGALRSRARWLEAILHMRDELTEVSDATGRIVIRKIDDVGRLGPGDRLFGVSGFRGLLVIDGLEVSSTDGRAELTSVKLDRFSGAPIDGALFTTEVFVGVRLHFRLRLDRRPGIALDADTKTLFDALCSDIRTNGLQLGAGAAKGFGWFEEKPA